MIFSSLLNEGFIKPGDILKTEDGFHLVYKSIADILALKGIVDFPDSEGARLLTSRFFDDWFLYAVTEDSRCTYGLLKLREQEFDAEDGLPADGDTPGVTVSFIAFDLDILLNCLSVPSDENRIKLDGEINRVVCRRGQRHHSALKKYFSSPKSEGAYLVAELYPRHIASFARDGALDVPEHYKEIVQQSISYKFSPKAARLPRFIASLNEKAQRTVCDNEKIYIEDSKNLSEYEKAAILATHTANTSVYSFAAELEYHAKFLMPILRIKLPFFGKSIYESAIRADMTIDDGEFEGPAPFHRHDSKIVKRQIALHGNK